MTVWYKNHTILYSMVQGTPFLSPSKPPFLHLQHHSPLAPPKPKPKAPVFLEAKKERLYEKTCSYNKTLYKNNSGIQWHITHITQPKWFSAVKCSKKPSQTGHSLRIHWKGDMSISEWTTFVAKNCYASNHHKQFCWTKTPYKVVGPTLKLIIPTFGTGSSLRLSHVLVAAHPQKITGSFSSCTCRSKGAPPEFTNELIYRSEMDFWEGLIGKAEKKNVTTIPLCK